MNTTIHAEQSYKIISRHDIADVLFNNTTHHHSLFANIAFEPGDLISNFFAATTQNNASYLTVQTGINQHITLAPTFLQYINHGCDPNIFFDTTAMQLFCIKSIRSGDELRFFYPSTEWKMAQPFVCNCGSIHCLQLVSGAAQVNPDTLAKYRLTDFIIQQLKLNT
ncbi:MAG: SET domain-containing protein-lysine N-methyltransferase [Ferruginibacter sp.]